MRRDLMLGFFPKPYTNEIYASLIARYDLLSMNTGRGTVKELFGVNRDLDIEYPIGLSELIKSIEIFSCEYTAGYFLEKHTTYPFYKIFHPDLFSKELATNNFDMKGNYKRKRNTRALKVKFCEKCIKEHNNKYGDVYINRIHQIPGVLVCSRHNLRLSFMRNLATSNLPPQYILPSIENLNGNNISTSESLMRDLLLYESDIQYIFGNTLPKLSLKELRKRYIEFLKVKGLGYPIRKRPENSWELVKGTYSQEFLSLFGLENDKGDFQNWISNIISNSPKVNGYVNHIVFMRALAGSVKKFFEENIEYKPFGNGPWICMNPFCLDYRDKIVKNVETGIHNLTGLIYGDIKCHCGFIYRLRENENNPFKIPYFSNRVMDRGEVWEKAVYRLREDNFLIKEIAKRAGVTRPTIRKFLNNNYNNTRWDRLEVERGIKTRRYKEKWLKIRESNPTLNRGQLNSLNRAIYAWLRRYEPDWIEANSPKSMTGSNKKNINLDIENLISQIKELYSNWILIENSMGKLKRRTFNQLTAQVKIPGSYQNYPEVCNAINEFLESVTDFRKRKIKKYLSVKCIGKVVRYSDAAEMLGLRTPIRQGDEEIKVFLLEEIEKHNDLNC